MKREAIFVNTGRGATVDERGLIKALEQGWIAPPGSTFWSRSRRKRQCADEDGKRDPDRPRRLGLGALRPARRRRVGAEIALALTGRWPRSCVNPGAAGEVRSAALAARLDGARPELLSPFPTESAGGSGRSGHHEGRVRQAPRAARGPSAASPKLSADQLRVGVQQRQHLVRRLRRHPEDRPLHAGGFHGSSTAGRASP